MQDKWASGCSAAGTATTRARASESGGHDVTPVRELASRVRAVYERVQPPGSDPMLDFDERDLVRLATDTGFSDVSLTYEAKIERRALAHAGWDVFARSGSAQAEPSPEEVGVRADEREREEREGGEARDVPPDGGGQRRPEREDH